jgi:hypothetical protein
MLGRLPYTSIVTEKCYLGIKIPWNRPWSDVRRLAQSEALLGSNAATQVEIVGAQGHVRSECENPPLAW